MTAWPRWRALAALTALVLAAHLLALLQAPGIFYGPQRQVLRMATRSIAPPAPAPEEKRPAAREKPARAAPESIAKQAPPPAPTPGQAEPAAAAEPTAAAEAAAPATPAEPPAAAEPLRERALTAGNFSVAEPARLRYAVTAQARGGLWHGKGVLEWKHDGSNYDIQLEISTLLLPSRVQQSTGRIGDTGLAPLRFSDKARSEEAAHFEREKGRIVFSTNRPQAPLLAGAQDRLSVLLQLGAMLAAAPQNYPPATTIEVQTAGTRDAELWLFTVREPETLALPGGSVEAVKLVRNPRKEFDQQVELWLAPGMAYAPVRLRLTQANGDWLDLQWSATDRG